MNGVDSRNFFLASLAAAVVVHLFLLEGFLLVVPFKNFPREKGMAFLGSILDSSQMQRRPLLKHDAEKEQAVFSRYVPPRSEKEYFKNMKDVTKPEAGARGRKKDVKSLFPATKHSSSKNVVPVYAGEAAEYRPLKLMGSP